MPPDDAVKHRRNKNVLLVEEHREGTEFPPPGKEEGALKGGIGGED